MADLIKIPEINKLVLNDFRPHSYGGNQWYIGKNNGNPIWFISFPGDSHMDPHIQVKESVKDGGYKTTATIYFKRVVNGFEANRIRDDVEGVTTLVGDKAFFLSGEVFSGNWTKPLGMIRERVMCWNSERPPKEIAVYRAKEATYHLLETLDITNPENVQAFAELD